MNTFTEILKSYNLKVTPQRLAIVHIISRYGHITIEALHQEILKQFNSVSLATIYKNINTMTEEGLLLEVKLPNEKSVYEVVKNRHAHLKCEACGDVEDMVLDTDEIFANLAQGHNFKINHSDVVLSGICGKCQSELPTSNS